MSEPIPLNPAPEELRETWTAIALQCVDMREPEAAAMAIQFACMNEPPADWPVGSRGAAIRDGEIQVSEVRNGSR